MHQESRATYRLLKLDFELDDEAFEDRQDELLFSHPEITEVDGRGLVWNGELEKSSPPQSERSAQPSSQSPASYTPKQLAERRQRLLFPLLLLELNSLWYAQLS